MRRTFYRGSFWGAAVGLPLALGWCLLDPKGDARQHLFDHGVRFLNWLRV